MSLCTVSLQMIGSVEPLEAFTVLLEGLSYSLRRKGERIDGSRRVQEGNVLVVDLAEWEERSGSYDGDDRDAILANEQAQIAAMTATLQRLAPALSTLDRSEISAALWISTIREEEQGGFALPPELVAAAAAAGLWVEVSILVLFGPDEAIAGR
jgi:hypothetical protein